MQYNPQPGGGKYLGRQYYPQPVGDLRGQCSVPPSACWGCSVPPSAWGWWDSTIFSLLGAVLPSACGRFGGAAFSTTFSVLGRLSNTLSLGGAVPPTACSGQYHSQLRPPRFLAECSGGQRLSPPMVNLQHPAQLVLESW